MIVQQLVCNQIMSIEHKKPPFYTRVFCAGASSFSFFFLPFSFVAVCCLYYIMC